MEEEEREQHHHTVHGNKDRIMEVITQNIRLPGEGEEDIVTPRLKEILRGIHRGDRARLAEAITLGKCITSCYITLHHKVTVGDCYVYTGW